jgi:hypothetical protein
MPTLDQIYHTDSTTMSFSKVPFVFDHGADFPGSKGGQKAIFDRLPVLSRVHHVPVLQTQSTPLQTSMHYFANVKRGLIIEKHNSNWPI